MLNRIKYAFYRFMQGRYGTDQLNTFLVWFSLTMVIINIFVQSSFIVILNNVIVIVFFFRAFSRNYSKRYAENQKFLALSKPVSKQINCIKRNLKDKDHRYYLCPSCSQLVRVPSKRGKVEITCPSCRRQFSKRT